MGHAEVRELHIPKPIGGRLPEPPVFASLDDERQHRKLKLAAAFRIFARFGLAEGIAGHITVRDPEFHDRFWVNPYAQHFSSIHPTISCVSTRMPTFIMGPDPSTPLPRRFTAASTARIRTSLPQPIHTRLPAARFQRAHGFLLRSIRKPVSSTTIMSCSEATWSCSPLKRVAESRRQWAPSAPPFCSIMAC